MLDQVVPDDSTTLQQRPTAYQVRYANYLPNKLQFIAILVLTFCYSKYKAITDVS